jgi:hypothetical protein
MSDTPRNDKLTDQAVGCSDALHLVLVDELSRNLERELAEARRQVATIIEVVANDLCPPNTPCVLKGEDRCIKCWSAWAAQQAKEGGGK